MLRYLILLPTLLVYSLFATAQGDFEFGFGVLGAGIAVEPIPSAYRPDFSGPITYLGYYAEASALLSRNEKWKPRAIVRLQTEGSNASSDWPEMRFLGGGAGCIVGYQFTPVISFLAGGVANYQLSAHIDPLPIDQPQVELDQPLSGRLNFGVRGDFGRWSSEMLIEKSFTRQTGAVLLSREGSDPFQPTYSFLNVRLGVKYMLFQSAKS